MHFFEIETCRYVGTQGEAFRLAYNLVVTEGNRSGYVEIFFFEERAISAQCRNIADIFAVKSIGLLMAVCECKICVDRFYSYIICKTECRGLDIAFARGKLVKVLVLRKVARKAYVVC